MKYIYGIYASAYINNSTGTTATYGLYGNAYGNADDEYGVYFSGGLGGSGTKSAVIRTEDGPKAVYCQESPENWFEDFGSGTVTNGKAVISIKDDFAQTVTINNNNPMKVFITPNANFGNWWVEKNDSQFIVYAPDAENGSPFDYRVVAKRKGFENMRLKESPAAYTDHYLYPDIKDVPQKYRLEWVRLIPEEQRKESWNSYLSAEQLKILEQEKKPELQEMQQKPPDVETPYDNTERE